MCFEARICLTLDINMQFSKVSANKPITLILKPDYTNVCVMRLFLAAGVSLPLIYVSLSSSCLSKLVNPPRNANLVLLHFGGVMTDSLVSNMH